MQLIDQTRAALDARGVTAIGIGERPWDAERDVIFDGGTDAIRVELDLLVQGCRGAGTDVEARRVLEEYLLDKK